VKLAKEGDNEDAPEERKIDKEALREKLGRGDYDISLHFSKKAKLDLDKTEKFSRFIHGQGLSNKQAEVYLAG
jgi:hypothetical protein